MVTIIVFTFTAFTASNVFAKSQNAPMRGKRNFPYQLKSIYFGRQATRELSLFFAWVMIIKVVRFVIPAS